MKIKQFEKATAEIMEVAKGFGLDFYDMRFEIVPADIMYMFGGYGMPTRYSHWSFGKAFHRLKMEYDLNLSRIYELVINNDPCYAFFLEGNTLIQNKMIAAHVLAHCDFFKNNIRFSRTNRQMVESMAASAERIRQYRAEYGGRGSGKVSRRRHGHPRAHRSVVDSTAPPSAGIQPKRRKAAGAAHAV